MSEVKALREALAQIVDSYLYLTDGVGVITDDAYLTARAALRLNAGREPFESLPTSTDPTETQRIDPYEMIGEVPQTHKKTAN